MNCDLMRDRFDGYLAGTLDRAEREAVDRHLAGCAECRSDLESSRFLTARTAGLRREIAPTTDLWTGIAPRLRPATRQLAIPAWRLVAAAIVLMAATSALTIALLRREQVPVGGFASTEARYSQAALELGELYLQARDSLAPETRAVLERNLAVIERALAEARDALRADPANRMLESMVVAAYQRKIAFLERVAALDRET